MYFINVREKGQFKMDNLEKLTIYGTRDEEKKQRHNIICV